MNNISIAADMAHPPPGPFPAPGQPPGPWDPPDDTPPPTTTPPQRVLPAGYGPSQLYPGLISFWPEETCAHGFHGAVAA